MSSIGVELFIFFLLFILLFRINCVILSPEIKYVRIMTSFALNNLWTYIEGLSLKKKDREWLASKLIEPTVDDNTKTARQKAYVKETLTRALKDVEAAKREGRKLQTVDEFLKELRMEEETA